ncbi:hypothetical protein [Vibrio vulnificus]|uniref:hypothetical protein n=1 Tax=Vibrio vulnificus TaxID=672 RepID=UPI001EEC6A74|nr:hypothetical protein [Vibrio vulnificus]MCG6288879.1 hypothetical protein [Vibrio vulnificus]
MFALPRYRDGYPTALQSPSNSTLIIFDGETPVLTVVGNVTVDEHGIVGDGTREWG